MTAHQIAALVIVASSVSAIVGAGFGFLFGWARRAMSMRDCPECGGQVLCIGACLRRARAGDERFEGTP